MTTPIRPRLLSLAGVFLVPTVLSASQTPPSHEDSRPSARIERVFVRDTLHSNGAIDRTTEATVSLNDSIGVSQFGQIGTPYIEGYGEVVFDTVVVEKPDGNRIEVRDAVTEELNPFGMSGLSLPADLRVRRLTVPGLAVGDRLRYRVTVRQKPLFPGIIFGEFQFVTGPAAGAQIYELDAPKEPFLALRLRPELGSDWETLPSPPDRLLRRLTIDEAPLPEVEDSELTGEPDVQFTTFRTWDEVGHWWWALAGKRFSPDDTVRSEALRLTEGVSSAGERMDALRAFVAGQIRYLSVGFGSGRYEPRPASEVLTARYADCKGKHALLAALGETVGVEVRPVLVHSWRDAIQDDVPSPAQFDHLISVVKVGDASQWLWIDATNELAPTGYLPPNLRGKRALLVDEQGGRVVTIPEEPPFPTRTLVELSGSIDLSGPLRARVRWTLRDDMELLIRATTLMTPKEQWPDLGKALAKEWTRGVVGEVKTGEASAVEEPFWIEYAVEHKMTPKTFAKDWTLWVPLPEMSLPDVEPGGKEAAAELEGAKETVFRARVELPEPMRARAPLSVTLDRPFASYRSVYAVDGRVLTVERVLVVRRRRIESDEVPAYEAFRSAVQADRVQEFSIEALEIAAAETGGPSGELDSADALNAAGFEALDRGDARSAADLLRRAVEMDPRHKWAWNNLGRALRQLGEPEEALQAFDRQIDVSPYDPYAYDNRGATLFFDLGRTDEAERDFLKQIEVAPLEFYAYRDLASVRTKQERHGEAADLLDQAIAIRSSDAALWLALAWARARAGREDAAAAVERVIAIDGSPRISVIAARALVKSGDAEAAARIVKQTLPKLLGSLDVTDERNLDAEWRERDVLFVSEAWRLLGAPALASGDLATAERYLVAAWELGATPDAAADLGRVREEQGRRSEALRIWQLGSVLPGENRSTRELEQAVSDSVEVEALVRAAPQELAKLRVQRISPSAAETIEIRLRLLVDEGGRVHDVRAERSQDADKLSKFRDIVLAAKLPPANPDGVEVRLVRGGTLSCYTDVGCNLGMDLYGDEIRSVLER